MDHKPLPDISGGLKCSCGEDLGRFPLDSDKWEVWDLHLADEPKLWALYQAGLDGGENTAPTASLVHIIRATTEALEKHGWRYVGDD